LDLGDLLIFVELQLLPVLLLREMVATIYFWL
jgi:hypothetical protein